MTLQERMDNIKKEHEAAVLQLNRAKDAVKEIETRIYQLQGQYQVVETLMKDAVPEATNG